MMRSITALCLLLPSVCSSALADQVPLGRLLYTPQERQRLESQRAAAQSPGAIGPSRLGTRSMRLQGMITRSDGHAVAWLDGLRVQPKRFGLGRTIEARLRSRIGREVTVRSAAPVHAAGMAPVTDGDAAR